MAYKGLQHFIQYLKDQEELVIVDVPVDPVLEMTEIVDRLSKKQGPAVLFTHPIGSTYPVLMNAMGTWRRMGMALGEEAPDDIGKEIEGYLQLEQYLHWKTLIKSIPRFFRLVHVFSWHLPFRGHCQEVVERNPDLNTLPVLKCWPLDGGRFLTLPIVFTKSAVGKGQNVGMYRMQVLDGQTTAMHWHKHKDGSENFRQYKEKGMKMPVAVALGCDPAITYAATSPLPKPVDEMLFAGWLRKKGVRMVRCLTNDLEVPADAEFILEGYVDPEEDLVMEGPFGDHTGYYSLEDMYPRFHVTCLTHRKSPVYPATIVGRPPMEDCYLAKATERIFLPFLRLQIPELVDLHLPLEGVFHNCAIVSIRNTYPGAARKVMYALWGMGQMMYTKMIIVTDGEVPVQQEVVVLEKILEEVRGREDFCLTEGPLDALDHASALPLYGTRMGIDATAKEENKGKVRKDARLKVFTIHKAAPFEGRERVRSYLKQHSDKLVICVDDTVDEKDLRTVFWKVFNNIDAARDLVVLDRKIGVDATAKWKKEGLTRSWPTDIVMTPEVKERVTERWGEYGLDPYL